MREAMLLKIGRALDNDVVLNIPFISDYHLEIFQDPEGNVFMTDLNSANGTFVNGKKLNGFLMLQAKDEVFLGNGFKLQWEQLLLHPNNTPKEDNTKVSVNKEPKKYVDAYEDVRNKSNTKTESTSTTKIPKPFFKEHLDIIIIYGLIIAFLLYFYLKVS